MSKKYKIDVAIAVAEGYLSTDNIIADGEVRSCALAVAGLVEVMKLFADELNEFRHREASTSLEADAPEIAAAEARGRVEGLTDVRDPTDAMLEAARIWSYHKYGKPIGSEAAIGCWQAMIDANIASLQTEKDGA